MTKHPLWTGSVLRLPPRNCTLGAFVGAALAFAVVAATPARAQVWEADPSFAADVIMETSLAEGAQFVAAADGRVLAFATSVAGSDALPAGSIVRLTADGSLDTGFRATFGTSDSAADVAPLADGRVVVVLRTLAQPRPTYRIVRVKADGSPDFSFPPLTLDASARTLLLADGRVLVWGDFQTIGGVARNALARLTADGTLDTTYAPDFGALRVYVTAVAALADGRVYFSGYGSDGGTGSAFLLRRVATDGTFDTSFTPEGIIGTTYSLLAALPDASVLAGNGNVFRLRSDGSRDSAYALQIPDLNRIWKINIRSDGKLLVEASTGSGFAFRRRSVFVLSSSGAVEKDMRPLFQSGRIMEFLAALPDGRALVRHAVPRMEHVGGVVGTRTSLEDVAFARVEVTTTAAEPLLLDAAFRTRAPGLVARLNADSSGRIIASGSFTQINGQRRLSVARFLASGALDATFAPDDANALQRSVVIVQPDGAIIVSETVLGAPDSDGYVSAVRRVARICSDGTRDTAFTPPSQTISPANRAQWHAATSDGRFLVSYFDPNPNAEENFKLVWLGNNGAILNLLPTRFAGGRRFGQVFDDLEPPLTSTFPNPLAQAVPLANGDVQVWGAFTSVNGIARAGLARVHADGALDAAYAPTEIETPRVAIADYFNSFENPLYILPDGRVIGARTSLATGLPVRAVVRLKPDGALDPAYAILPEVSAPRLDDGTPDLNFPLRFSLPDGKPAALGASTFAGDGSLWTAARVSGEAPRLARLVPHNVETITAQPLPSAIVAGRDTYLQVAIGTTEPATYQWYLNGNPIAGADRPLLWLSSVRTSQAGSYSVRITVGGNVLTSNTASVGVAANTARLVNFSARGRVAPGASQIAGVVVNTATPRPVLVRAVGASLSQFGVPQPWLRDATLDIFRGQQWIDRGTSPPTPEAIALAKRLGAFALVPSTTAPFYTESVFNGGLAEGALTFHVSCPTTAAAGTALFEFYDAADLSTPACVRNISIRARTGSGSELLTPGFVIAGIGPLRLLVRAIGPSLAAFGVSDIVSNPALVLRRSPAPAPIGTNDDWGGDGAIADAAQSTGAFPLALTSRDAALIVTLEPGSYTAQVTSTDGTGGEALAEIYVLDP